MMPPLLRLGREVSIFASVAFALHYIWESLHVRLYTGYEGLSGDIPLALWASIGDVLYSVAALALLMLIRRRYSLLDLQKKDLAILAFFGFLIALGVEYKALALYRWAYTEAMPIIPLLGVGLSPILQMTALLPFSAYLARSLFSRT